MTHTNTGGPAFPAIKIISGDNYNPPTKLYYAGMTLRDYFAAKALTGFFGIYHAVTPNTGDTKAQALAKLSYEMADAMLQAREA